MPDEIEKETEEYYDPGPPDPSDVAKKKYLKSAKGKAATKRYRQSEKGKQALAASQARYYQKQKFIKESRIWLEAHPGKTLEDFVKEVE